MVQDAGGLRLLSKRARRGGGKASGSTLIATSRPRPGVPRAVDLAHAARADGGEDLVGAKAGTGCQRHGVGGILDWGGGRDFGPPLTLPLSPSGGEGSL